MSLDSIHNKIAKKEFSDFKKSTEKVRERFNKTEKVTIDISLSHLDFLKESIITPLKNVVETEKEMEKKPATIVYEEISAFSDEELRKWIIEAVLKSYVNQYIQNKTKESQQMSIEEEKSLIIS